MIGRVHCWIKDNSGIATSAAVNGEVGCHRRVGLPVMAVDSYGGTTQVDRAIEGTGW